VRRRSRTGLAAAAFLVASLAQAAASAAGPGLDFSIREGRIGNHFFREGEVAAHTVLTDGREPRLVVAFPAGNSGVSLWFRPTDPGAAWSGAGTTRAVRGTTADGDPLHGIETQLVVEGGTLVVDAAVLGSVRVIRDYLHSRSLDDELAATVSAGDDRAHWYRDRLDGEGGYRLELEILAGSVSGGAGEPVTLSPSADGRLSMRLRALTGDPPLTPIPRERLLTDEAGGDPLARRVLAFLSYEEKLLAGSWRFLTYFGRDTLMSVRLLMPVLTPAAIEAGLGSVLARLNPAGEVAHEEDIGEFALLRRDGESDRPLYDYMMRDDDFMLAPIAAHYLLDHGEGRRRAAAFLAAATPGGEPNGKALAANLRFVLEQARPFASDPRLENLVWLKEDAHAAQWRDSREGLGFGRIPWDVNAVFVPAALRAIARFADSGLLDTHAADGSLADAGALAKAWEREAPAFFEVRLPAAAARDAVAEYARDLAVPEEPAIAALEREQGAVTFNAVALRADGSPVAVLNSDEGFALLFGELSARDVQDRVRAMLRPFPAGLLTPVGLVTANPAYAPADVERVFTRGHYHGTTIWSWQQALVAAGLDRQLARDDLPAETRNELESARERLWQAIGRGRELQNSELWSWAWAGDEWQAVPFGQRRGDETESNAAQLWSTVYLALEPPAPGR